MNNQPPEVLKKPLQRGAHRSIFGQALRHTIWARCSLRGSPKGSEATSDTSSCEPPPTRMVARQADVPVWPGPPYVPKAPYSQHSHHRSQTFTVQKGYAVEQPCIMADAGLLQNLSQEALDDTTTSGQQETVQHTTSMSRTPKWIENDGKVFRWYGYFKEAVPESPIETYRVRRVVIHYYLVDDTIDVEEPKQLNSGIDQGILLKRHKISGTSGRQLAPEDLQIGQTVTAYGRVYHITSVDAFTRQHLAERGITVAPDEQIPACPYDAWLATHNTPGSPLRSSALTNTLSGVRTHTGSMKHIEDCGKVLRFFCLWDDRQALFGDRRPYRLHYFLEDGSCEILETREANSGREPFPVFLRRGLLPKDGQPQRPGYAPAISDCFGPQDFRIGTTLTLYGRQFLVHDCDAFTRTWLQESLGYSVEDLTALDVREPLAQQKPRELPAHNGFGSWEDSAQNCTSLVPRPPRKDFYKLMSRDRIVLRFAVRLVETPGYPLSKTDRNRSFVLSCFLSDDTLAIFEPVIKNSGIVGGKYLERRQVMWPTTNRAIKDTDLHVGTVLPVLKRSFELLDADEFTYQYMENNRQAYPLADPQLSLASLANVINTGLGAEPFRQKLAGLQTSSTGLVPVTQVAALLQDIAATLSRHQVIAILRNLPRTAAQQVSVDSLVGALGL